VYIHPLSTGLRLEIPRTRPENISDPLGKLSYKDKSAETYNTPVSILNIDNEEDIDYALTLLKQVRKLSFKA
jgi:hypothetical protein